VHRAFLRSPRIAGRRFAGLLILAVVAVGSAGCSSVANYVPPFLSAYRPDVQQGNIVTAEMTENLHPGLTRDQVKFILGTPLLASAFHLDRWDYVYYLRRRNGEIQSRRLTVIFNGNKVESIAHDTMPPETMADNLILGRDAKRIPKPAKPPPPADEGPSGSPSSDPTAPIPGTPTNPTAPQRPS
jgi:outer membrane protein assembly factor BamE